jgi:hypothetical protein
MPEQTATILRTEITIPHLAKTAVKNMANGFGGGLTENRLGMK